MEGLSNLARFYRARAEAAIEACNNHQFAEADRICHELLSEPACPLLWRAEANYILGTSDDNLAAAYAEEAVRIYGMLAERSPDDEHYKERLATSEKSLQQVRADEEAIAKEEAESKPQALSSGVDKTIVPQTEADPANIQDQELAETESGEDSDGTTSFLFESDLDDDEVVDSNDKKDDDGVTKEKQEEKAEIKARGSDNLDLLSGSTAVGTQHGQSSSPLRLMPKTIKERSISPSKRKHSSSSSSGSPTASGSQLPPSSQTVIAGSVGSRNKKKQRLEEQEERDDKQLEDVQEEVDFDEFIVDDPER